MLFDGVLEPVAGRLRPDPDRPGLGIELKRADAERFRPMSAAGHDRHFDGMDTVTPVDDLRRPRRRRPGARRRAARPSSTARCASTAAARATYSTDASNYRQVPIGVVVPRTIDDVVATVAACHRHGVPITSRGGGTSLAGQCHQRRGDHRLLQVPEPGRARSIPRPATAVVEPGCNLDDLRDAAAEHGLTFGPDPATHNRNTLGGMIGNNSCGVHSVMAEFYGPGPLTADQVIELDVLTYDGHRMTVGATSPRSSSAHRSPAATARARSTAALRDLRDRHEHAIRTGYPDIPRRVSGFNLDRLLPEQRLRRGQGAGRHRGHLRRRAARHRAAHRARPARTLVVLGYPDVYAAGDHVPLVREHRPVGLEGIDAKLIDYMRTKGLHPDDVDLLPEGDGFLLVEFGADTKADADDQASALHRAR